jgi:hypothetical protein
MATYVFICEQCGDIKTVERPPGYFMDGTHGIRCTCKGKPPMVREYDVPEIHKGPGWDDDQSDNKP